MELPERPWEALPSDLADALRPQLPSIAQDIVETVRTEVAEYGGVSDADTLRRLRLGVEHALAQFAEVVGRSGPAPQAGVEFHRALGRAAQQTGRSLDGVQDVFRVASRVAWRWMGWAATEAGLPAAQLHLLAESIFVYIDELASYTVDGYAEAQSAAAGERHQRRAQVLALLLAQPPAEPAALVAAAGAAAWPLPKTVAVAALGREESAGDLAARIGPDVLAGSQGDEPCLVVPDPDGPGRRALAAGALTGRDAAMGPTTEPAHAARSLDWARRTLDLARRGLLERPASPPRADDHLAELVLAADTALIGALARRRLAPLQALGPRSRNRLAETLVAWLEQGRSAPAAARVLHAHAQTVRYRLAQVRELLGDAVDDPAARFELELALRGQRLLD
jgi:hypothetical protein